MKLLKKSECSHVYSHQPFNKNLSFKELYLEEAKQIAPYAFKKIAVVCWITCSLSRKVLFKYVV